jgi:hypothetical protein
MRGLPGWVLSDHAEDEILNYLGGRSSPNRLSTEINSQYQRNPARCHRTTVSGVTTESACFQPAPEPANEEPEKPAERL